MSRYLEDKVIDSTINELLGHGFALSVNDGEETTLLASQDKQAIKAAMQTTDEDYLLVHRTAAHKSFGWVRFIYGNDGWDVISDYTTNLEQFLTATNALTDEMSA